MDMFTLLDSSLNYDWNMPDPGYRNLDPLKVKDYIISTPEPLFKDFVTSVLDHTKYYDFYKFKAALLISLNKFIQEIADRPFYIFFNLMDRIGSEQWLVLLLWNRLRNLNVKGFITSYSDQVPEDSSILIIDDAIYSGTNMISLMDNYTYGMHEINRRPIMYQFHLVVPYVSLTGGIEVESFNTLSFISTIRLYSHIQTYSIREILSHEHKILSHYDLIISSYGIEGDPVPIYFDHKIGNEFASFPTIYLEGRIPNRSSFGPLMDIVPSRRIIKNVETFIKDRLATI